MSVVSRVWLNSDAYLVCLTHAMSNETEEIMGLCIGDTEETKNGYEITISAVMLLRRMDKRKDRVEISVEQLSKASTVAENMARKTGKPLHIVGWYHSHPHITVWPSHVDLRTQAMYQLMDKTFVGLIFSCFNETKSNLHQKVEMTCFQSLRSEANWEDSQHHRVEIPIDLKRMPAFDETNLQTLIDLPKILVQEENEAYEIANRSSSSHILTRIHNASAYAQTLCNVTETITSPMLHLLHSTDTSRCNLLDIINKQNDVILLRIEKLKKKIQEKSALRQ